MRKIIITVLVILITTSLFSQKTEMLREDKEVVVKSKDIIEANIWFCDQVKLKNNSVDTLTVKVIVNKNAKRNKKGFYKLVKLNPNSTKVVVGYSFKGCGGTILGSKKISNLEVIVCE